ncbi:MAG: class I SAM-dependent methyltransferase [Planctomycetota bacterium]
MASTDCNCPACGSDRARDFFTVANIPIHCVLLMRTREEATSYPRGDLTLAHCAACGFVWNRRFLAELHEYSPRCEESQAFSGTFNRFARELADDYLERYSPRTALEIGCGKGDFLALLCERGELTGVGIDPGLQPERIEPQTRGKVEWIVDFYSPKYRHLVADLVLCRHTLEHIADVAGFVRSVRQSAPESAVVSFELPDLERILIEGAFWDIYYEHCSYFTLGSLARLFRREGFAPIRLEKCFGDQYLILDARPAAAPETAPIQPGESDLDRTAAQVRDFEARVPSVLDAWRAWFRAEHARGRRTVLWGSGSKAVAFVTTLPLDEEVLAVTDVNPYRHRMFLPGSGHEIVPPAELVELRPDNVVVMNPVYVEEIRRDLASMGLRPTLLALGTLPPAVDPA